VTSPERTISIPAPLRKTSVSIGNGQYRTCHRFRRKWTAPNLSSFPAEMDSTEDVTVSAVTGGNGNTFGTVHFRTPSSENELFFLRKN
jgi:hypothetical protein